ncbi:MAG: hypothetical protein H6R08_1419, partial [Proteobacteria bacterium]|nr:hypothetical protein [Pseudomonadota bacterium]
MARAPRHHRTLWISDIHLGTAGCQARYLLDFLKHNESDTLYLVGDIIDGWQLRKGWYWPRAHNDVVQKLLRKARKGTRVIYVPGNHDSMARQFMGLAFGDIEVADEVIHVTADGRRFLVTHGDLFDGVMQHARWLAYLGDSGYTLILALNRWFNGMRTRMGYPYWSLSQYIKHKVKNAVSFITAFEKVMTDEARRRNCDGVICGHIHKAERRRHLRPHPQGGDPQPRRPAVLQRRRLGGKPDRARRNRRRHARNPPLDPLPGHIQRSPQGNRTGDTMKVMIVTDAWSPQVNGVVRTLTTTRREMQAMGHQVDILSPLEFRTLPCPTYPDIRLSVLAGNAAR